MTSVVNSEEHKDEPNIVPNSCKSKQIHMIRELTPSRNPGEQATKKHNAEDEREEISRANLRILLTGSSHIHRLQSYILRGCLPCSRLDFGTGQDVYFLGIGGAEVSTLRNSSHLESLLVETRPDVVVVHIGSNDADSDKTSSDICAEIFGFVRILKARFRIPKVYVSQLFFRKATRRISVEDYNKKILEINRQLRKDKTATSWKHKGMMEPVKTILLKDGVHLNPFGQELFYKSFKKSRLRSRA